MAHVIDVRNSDGKLVILGNSLSLPSSSNTDVSTIRTGSIRYNAITNNVEIAILNNNTIVWQSIITSSNGTDVYLPLTGGSLSGNLTVNGTVSADYFSGEAIAALYAADIAERYHADAYYEPGTVLIIGGKYDVTLSYKENDTSVIGIVSTKPAYKMNIEAGDDKTHPYIALKGCVPCKVVGPIKKGDLLTTSSKNGYAKAADNNVHPKAIFAKALENFNDNFGIIKVYV